MRPETKTREVNKKLKSASYITQVGGNKERADLGGLW